MKPSKGLKRLIGNLSHRSLHISRPGTVAILWRYKLFIVWTRFQPFSSALYWPPTEYFVNQTKQLSVSGGEEMIALAEASTDQNHIIPQHARLWVNRREDVTTLLIAFGFLEFFSN